jgi:uracil-DNA glycosylase
MVWKQVHREQRIKLKRKAKHEPLGLGTPVKELQTVPMEENRERGMMLVGRALGQGVRSRRPVHGEQDSTSDRLAEAIRQGRR